MLPQIDTIGWITLGRTFARIFVRNCAQVDVEIEAEEAKKHKDPDKAIAMTDVDPQYFTELHGRPVKETFTLERYVQDTREIFRTRLLMDQERDDCIRIDQQFEQESRRLRKLQVIILRKSV